MSGAATPPAPPGRRSAPPEAPAALVVAVAVVACAAVVPVVGGLAPWLAVRALPAAAFVAAGAAVWYLGRGRALGWLFLLCGCALGVINLGLTTGPAAATLRVLTGGYPPFGAVLMHLLVSYPTGRLRGPFERGLLTLTYGVTAAYSLCQFAIADDSGARTACTTYPCPGIMAPLVRSDAAAAAVGPSIAVGYPLLVAAAVVAIARRWRALTPERRRVLRPALVSTAAAAGLGVLVAVLRGFGAGGNPAIELAITLVFVLGVAVVPVGLLAGVLRDRLVAYGMSDILVQLGTGSPAAELAGVVERLLGDPTAQVLLADHHGGGFVGLDGSAVPLPGQDHTRGWFPVGSPPTGVVVHAADAAPSPQLRDAVAGAVALVLSNQRLQHQLGEQLAEVDASRGRILQAADAERRRIERDLHDGAQQYLVSSALAVRLARGALRADPEQAEGLLGEAESQLGTALVELRRLARGLYPPVLVDSGIGAAVESLAQRSPVQVVLTDQLDDTDGPGRYPAEVEAAAYFVVCEALVNVAKHAGTDEAAVRLHRNQDVVVVEVRDTGRGSADPGRGSGMAGLADRVAAVGGSLAVTSRPGDGTLVRASLPCTGLSPR